MTNPKIETDLVTILSKLDSKIDKLDSRLGAIETGQVKLEGHINATDEKLSGQIKNLDEKLSGQIKNLDEKFSGEIGKINKDLTWIKWLFGILGSMVVLLLSIILTVTFKLLGN